MPRTLFLHIAFNLSSLVEQFGKLDFAFSFEFLFTLEVFGGYLAAPALTGLHSKK